MKRIHLVAGALLAATVSIGCALFFGPSSQELATIRSTLDGEDVLILDVRSPEEFAEEHLAGAVNVPQGEVEGRLDEVGPTDRRVVVYCQSGVRSGWATSTLRDAGYTQVHDLGGIDNGPEVGLEIVSPQ